jgi:hypothetical protein
MLTRVFRFSALALLLATFAGCGLFWDDPYVTVTVTPLNWVEIHYYNATNPNTHSNLFTFINLFHFTNRIFFSLFSLETITREEQK